MRSVCYASDIENLYVVATVDIDLNKVKLPAYIGVSWDSTPYLVHLWSGGCCADDGYEAIKAVYPDAEAYSDKAVAEARGRALRQ